MILNLKNFNKYVEYCKFKMDTLVKILTLVSPQCFMGSIDLSDEYFSIFVALLYQKFLKFQWKGQFYKFIAMPFGLTEAPHKFTKLCKPPLAIVRQNGFTIAAYLDDFFQCEKSYNKCKESIAFVHNLLVSLGFLPNDNKSMYEPCQVIESLGHIINSINMTVTLPLSKTEAIISICLQALQNPHFTIRHLCTIIGKLIHALSSTPWAAFTTDPWKD